MNLYEIDSAIEQAFTQAKDPETGEINEEYMKRLDELEMQRDQKVENIACYIKNLKADAAALKAEKDALQKRQKAAEAKAESLTRYLSLYLAGAKFSSPKASVTWRKTTRVEMDPVYKKKNALRADLAQRGILKREGNNTFDKYKYFSEAQYKSLFTELFSSHGLELRSTVSDYSMVEGTEKQANGRQVRMIFELCDTETGFSELAECVGEGFDKGDKAGYKAMTGALKYYLACNFLVATGDDPEVDSPDVKMNSKAKITAAQKNVIVTKYQGDALARLLEWAGVTSLDEMTIDQATRVVKQIKEKEEKR